MSTVQNLRISNNRRFEPFLKAFEKKERYSLAFRSELRRTANSVRRLSPINNRPCDITIPTLVEERELIISTKIHLVIDHVAIQKILFKLFKSLYKRQPRRQDSVTGGAEINFGGAREVYLCEFERGTGHEKFIPVWIKRTR